MGEGGYNIDDRIVALATPWTRSALAVIRTSGGGAVEAVASLFEPRGRLEAARGGTAHHGTLTDPESGEPLDEVIVTVFRAPASYTGEDAVEISCHGSLPGITALLSALRKAGFRDAGPGEFTLRAFRNGKLDLTRAEAVREIVESKSGRAHALALHRLSGSIEARVERAKSQLVGVLAHVELLLDYPEDEVADEVPPDLGVIDSVVVELSALLSTYRTGKIVQDGVRAALAGRTNAGKSSLFNLFLREDRSIVSETHGTTRDYIESWIVIGGVPVRLYDTAGIRIGGDDVESEGMRRSCEILDHAHLVMYLVDASTGITQEDTDAISGIGNQQGLIRIWSKADLTGSQPPDGFIAVSARTGQGFSGLTEELSRRIQGEADSAADAVVDSERQKGLLERCLADLGAFTEAVKSGEPIDAAAEELQSAVHALGEITGEVTTADILDAIFSNFCVGK